MTARASQAFTSVFTEEHEAVVAEACDEWTDSGLSTEPADRGAAERAVRQAYASAGLSPPRRVMWAESPAGCLRACVPGAGSGGPRNLDEFPPEVASRLWRRLLLVHRGHPWRDLEDGLRARLHDELGAELWGELRSQIRLRIREPLWDGLRVRLRGPVLSRLGDRIPWMVCGQLGGVQDLWRDAYWMALYACALRLSKSPPDERLESLAAATRHLGWWIPSRTSVILSERPRVLRRDELGRLHCATGPALSWPDGYALHAWHGTPVPGWVIENPTPEAIAAEGDAEVRRCAIESFGWGRYIAAANLPLLAEIEDPRRPGVRLALYDVPEGVSDEPLRVLVAVDAQTGGLVRGPGLTVPGYLSTRAAADWARELAQDVTRPRGAGDTAGAM